MGLLFVAATAGGTAFSKARIEHGSSGFFTPVLIHFGAVRARWIGLTSYFAQLFICDARMSTRSRIGFSMSDFSMAILNSRHFLSSSGDCDW